MIPMLSLPAQHAAIATALETAVAEVLASGRYVLDRQVAEFEAEVADYLGTNHTIGCASGTDALHLALRALEIGPGDEVITTAFTFAATAEAVRHAGARPVFVDIDPHTLNLSPERVAAAITPRTRAILPVHLFGRAVGMSPLQELARRHGLAIVEDCAQAFGATCRGGRVGTLGTAGCFSFFPTKNLGACGDGGLIATADADLARRLRALRNHGSTERNHHETVGYNSRLDELQAAILRVKLRHIDEYNTARHRVARAYEEGLTGLPGVETPAPAPNGEHVYHQYTILVQHRDAVRHALQAAGVASAVYYPRPLHQQPAFADDHDGRPLPIAERVAQRCLSLPIFPELGKAQVTEVIAALHRAVRTG